ncbi:MAG: APC family permease [Planctomycetaceae bacterium]|nr:APC family permease [Planctomycetaceae bacterium]
MTGMIGSGVFVTSGFAVESLGSRTLVMAAWLVGGLVALCGAVAYGGLARRLPKSGGEYLYLSRSLHPFCGFLAGMVSLTAGFSGGIAFAAMTCQEYAKGILLLPAWMPSQTLATAVIIICFLIHIEAGRVAARLNTSIVLLKILTLMCLIIFGYSVVGWPSAVAEQSIQGASTGATIDGFAMTVVWVMFSYTGFNEAIYVASEARVGRRTVPRALVLGTFLTTILYLAINDIFLRAAPLVELAGQSQVAAIAAAALGGRTAQLGMSIVIVLSTLSAAAGMTMAGSRVATAMAEDGLLPAWLKGRSGRSRAVLVQTVLAIILVYGTTLQNLLGTLSVTLSLCSAMTVATLFWPQKHADSEKPVGDVLANDLSHPSALVLVAATVYCVATLLFAGLYGWHDPWQLGGVVAIIVVAVSLWPWARSSDISAFNQSQHDSVEQSET